MITNAVIFYIAMKSVVLTVTAKLQPVVVVKDIALMSKYVKVPKAKMTIAMKTKNV